MSLNVLTQGGGAGGESASIFVTGLDENSTVTAAKDGKVLQGKWNSAESRFEITIKEYGMWAVEATNGTNTATQDVLVDAAVTFEISMGYDFYTTFDEKEDDWVEQGGTFNYGDGLYVPYGGAKGTLNVVASDYYKYLIIPCDLSGKWAVSFSTYVYTSANNGMGGPRIELLDADDNILAFAMRNDGWGANTSQSSGASVGDTSLYSSGAVTTLNGATMEHKFIYTGSSVEYYENDVLKGSVSAVLPAIASVRIAFIAYTNTSSYPIANIKIGYLHLDRQ